MLNRSVHICQQRGERSLHEGELGPRCVGPQGGKTVWGHVVTYFVEAPHLGYKAQHRSHTEGLLPSCRLLFSARLALFCPPS